MIDRQNLSLFRFVMFRLKDESQDKKIKQMIKYALKELSLDYKKVFIFGTEILLA